MEDSKRSSILEMIAEDMEKDAKTFEGLPFNGRTVAEYFGKHGAAIAALAKIMKSILEQEEVKTSEHTSNSK